VTSVGGQDHETFSQVGGRQNASRAAHQNSVAAGPPVYVIGEVGLLTAVHSAGMIVRADAAAPVVVVVVVMGCDRGLTYTKLKDAVLLLQRGAQLIGTNPDLRSPPARAWRRRPALCWRR
jgi:ribonucleotide monophosphatase NagD (HAD superfamily)